MKNNFEITKNLSTGDCFVTKKNNYSYDEILDVMVPLQNSQKKKKKYNQTSQKSQKRKHTFYYYSYLQFLLFSLLAFFVFGYFMVYHFEFFFSFRYFTICILTILAAANGKLNQYCMRVRVCVCKCGDDASIIISFA